MIDSGVSSSWEPGEIIYEAGSHPQEAFDFGGFRKY